MLLAETVVNPKLGREVSGRRPKHCCVNLLAMITAPVIASAWTLLGAKHAWATPAPRPSIAAYGQIRPQLTGAGTAAEAEELSVGRKARDPELRP